MVGCGYTKKQERKTRERNRRGRRKRKANNTTSKYNEKTKDHVRQMKELTEEWIQDWEKLVERGAKEDVQSLNGWWPPLKVHKLNPFPCQTHEWTGSGQRLDFFNNFDSRRGWEKNVARRARCLQIAFGQQTKGPANNMASVFLLLTRKSSMLGAMPICSTEETYNVTIKGDGWHARKCFFFASGGTVDGTNATRLRHCRASGGPFFCACLTLVGSHGKTGKHKGQPRIGKCLFSMGWLKCQRLLIFRRFVVDHTCRSLKQMQKGAVLIAKRSKWGRSTWLGWSDLVQRLFSIRVGTGRCPTKGFGWGWAVHANAGHTARLIQGTEKFAGGWAHASMVLITWNRTRFNILT